MASGETEFTPLVQECKHYGRYLASAVKYTYRMCRRCMANYGVVQTANLPTHHTLYGKWAYNSEFQNKNEFDKKRQNAVFFSKKQNYSGKNRMVGNSVKPPLASSSLQITPLFSSFAKPSNFQGEGSHSQVYFQNLLKLKNFTFGLQVFFITFLNKTTELFCLKWLCHV